MRILEGIMMMINKRRNSISRSRISVDRSTIGKNNCLEIGLLIGRTPREIVFSRDKTKNIHTFLNNRPTTRNHATNEVLTR